MTAAAPAPARAPAALLELRDLRVALRHRRRRRARGRRRQPGGRIGPHARDRRRVGLGQVGDLRVRAGPDARTAHPTQRGDPVRRPRSRERVRGAAAACAWRPHRDDLPGPAVGPASVLHDRRPARRGRPRAPRRPQARGAAARARAARARRDRRRQAPRGRLPARAVRRPAPARHDRDGARQRSRAADRRRADDRARRHGPGADPRAARASCSASARWRSCSSRTTSGSSPSSRTTSPSCTPGGSSSGRRCGRCSPRPSTPTRGGCCSRSRAWSARASEELVAIAGRPPSLIDRPSGCHFHPRCAFVRDAHRYTRPELAAARRRSRAPDRLPARAAHAPRAVGGAAPRRDGAAGARGGSRRARRPGAGARRGRDPRRKAPRRREPP